MMWTDTGFLLSKIAFQENSIIANFYTKKHGKCAGIVYGATSKKIKNYLQNGNELYLEYYSKSDNSLGYFKTEILKPCTSKFFSEKRKLTCIVSMLDLIKILTVDGQENSKIYNLIDKLFMLLNNNNWKSDYVFWELNLLKYIGFDLNLIDYCKYDEVENKKIYFIESASKKFPGIPSWIPENSQKQQWQTGEDADRKSAAQ